MSGMLDDFLYPSKGTPKPQAAGPQEGRITRITGEGAFFKIPEYSAQLEFGPAPWVGGGVEVGNGPDAHDHAVTPPPVGALCLVVFVGTGVERPWVVGWWA